MSQSKIGIGITAEFVRSGDHPFEYAVEQAARSIAYLQQVLVEQEAAPVAARR